MIFVTADTHFGHANIIRYCNRPWLQKGDLTPDGEWVSKAIAQRRAEEMNTAMIANWNAVVGKDDTVYLLGDFAFKDEEKAKTVCHSLNGEKILIRGNHDKDMGAMRRIGFSEVHDHSIMYKGVLMTHDPAPLLHAVNVGVDRWDFKPVPLDIFREGTFLCGHVHEKWIVK